MRVHLFGEARVLLRYPRMLASEVVVEFRGKFFLQFPRFFYFLDLRAEKIQVRAYFAAERFCLVYIDARLRKLAFGLRLLC